MKKLLTGLACCAMVLVGGVSLAACCGDQSLVDTSGKYADATYAQVEEVIGGMNQSQEISGYEFRLVYDVTVEEGTADVNITGKVDAEGNFSMNADMYLKSTSPNMTASLNGNIYYDAETLTWYVNDGDEKASYTDISQSESASPFTMFYSMIQELDIDYALNIFSTEESGGVYKISTSDSNTKIQLSLDVDGAASTIYFVMDSEGNFIGFKNETSGAEGKIIMEILAADTTVEFPSDLDSYTGVGA